MYLAIMIALMSARNVPTFTVDSQVYVTGRPGCTVQALHNDPRDPVIVCEVTK